MIILCIKLEFKKSRVFEIAEEWKSNAANTIFGWIVWNEIKKNLKYLKYTEEKKNYLCIHCAENSKEKYHQTKPWIICFELEHYPMFRSTSFSIRFMDNEITITVSSLGSNILPKEVISFEHSFRFHQFQTNTSFWFSIVINYAFRSQRNKNKSFSKFLQTKCVSFVRSNLWQILHKVATFQ